MDRSRDNDDRLLHLLFVRDDPFASDIAEQFRERWHQLRGLRAEARGPITLHFQRGQLRRDVDFVRLQPAKCECQLWNLEAHARRVAKPAPSEAWLAVSPHHSHESIRLFGDARKWQMVDEESKPLGTQWRRHVPDDLVMSEPVMLVELCS